MSHDNSQANPLDFLGQSYREMLELLAQRDRRTPIEELRSLIYRRFHGHLKDLGDDQGSFQLSRIAQVLKVDSLGLDE